jgi:hypothetical protein
MSPRVRLRVLGCGDAIGSGGRFRQIARRTRPLVIAGPSGTRARNADTLEALFPGASTARRSYETRFAELVGGISRRLGPATVTPFEVSHPSGAPAHPLRVEYGGRVIAYSGDTEWTENVVAVSRASTCSSARRSSTRSGSPTTLTLGPLAAKRAELDCERLVLTHMSDDMLVRLDELDIEAATDGAGITI